MNEKGNHMSRLFTFLIAIVMFSCSEGDNSRNDDEIAKDLKEQFQNTSEKEEESVSYSREQIQELKTASKVVYTLPSPAEMAQILHDTKAVYDIEILNSVDKLETYLTDFNQSLNLGVYFADLSFTSMFDFPQQAMMYMGAAQGLSEELNIDGVFTEDMMIRLEENLGNKDSLMQVVADAYLETDFALKDDNRPIVAKAILAGAWVEGLYIATNLKTESSNDQLVKQKIGEQKPALSNLVEMLESMDSDKLKLLIADLKLLQKAYEPITFEAVEDTSGNGKMAKAETINISQKSFKEIQKVVTKIRGKIINAEF